MPLLVLKLAMSVRSSPLKSPATWAVQPLFVENEAHVAGALNHEPLLRETSQALPVKTAPSSSPSPLKSPDRRVPSSVAAHPEVARTWDTAAARSSSGREMPLRLSTTSVP